MSSKSIGILGGGQLSRMMLEACNRLNVKAAVLDSDNCPAKRIHCSQKHIDGSFANGNDIEKLMQVCDVVTVDLEHINLESLSEMTKKYNRPCFPSVADIAKIQNKCQQKELYKNAETEYARILDFSHSKFENASEALSYLKINFQTDDETKPIAVVKKKIGSYDGKGNFLVYRETSIAQFNEFISSENISDFYAEEYIEFVTELAVMVLRTQDGNIFAYPCVETIQETNICKYVVAPAQISDELIQKAQEEAKRVISLLSSAGIFGVEMFLTRDGRILMNEIAPRPHNSGHYTIEACHMSQFESHIRAVLNLQVKEDSLTFRTENLHAIMINILGPSSSSDYNTLIAELLSIPRLSVHLYDKGISRPMRKMGHATITANSFQDCLKDLSHITKNYFEPKIRPTVGIIMGSDSDLPIMKKAAEILDIFRINYEITIVSAHRTPERMVSYAKSAKSRGLKVIIAGAGGAAHLPGMVASLTTLPVIGVPVKGSSLDGVDSLYSIVQMPRGIPVATVAINNAENAGLLSVRILGQGNEALSRKIENYVKEMKKQVEKKIDLLEQLGYREFLKQ